MVAWMGRGGALGRWESEGERDARGARATRTTREERGDTTTLQQQQATTSFLFSLPLESLARGKIHPRPKITQNLPRSL